MKKLAIFASGGGSNAEKIQEFFQNHPGIEIKLVVVNNKNAGIIEKALSWKVPILPINKISFYETILVSARGQERPVNPYIAAAQCRRTQ